MKFVLFLLFEEKKAVDGLLMWDAVITGFVG